jgi:hypothetical protein
MNDDRGLVAWRAWRRAPSVDECGRTINGPRERSTRRHDAHRAADRSWSPEHATTGVVSVSWVEREPMRLKSQTITLHLHYMATGQADPSGWSWQSLLDLGGPEQVWVVNAGTATEIGDQECPSDVCYEEEE